MLEKAQTDNRGELIADLTAENAGLKAAAGRETIDSIAEWAVQTFPGGDGRTDGRALRVLGEAVELCLAAGASTHQVLAVVYGEFPRWEDTDSAVPNMDQVHRELADVYVTCCGMAGKDGIDLQTMVDVVMRRNRYEREWAVGPDGTGQHID